MEQKFLVQILYIENFCPPGNVTYQQVLLFFLANECRRNKSLETNTHFSLVPQNHWDQRVIPNLLENVFSIFPLSFRVLFDNFLLWVIFPQEVSLDDALSTIIFDIYLFTLIVLSVICIAKVH